MIATTARPSSHRIVSVSIIGGFLDGLKFEFVPGLNCVIGPRGAGKTTILEFIRFALDLLPSRETNAAERRRIEALVERNLAGGRVEVEIQTKDELIYIVSRAWGEEPLVLTAARQPTELTLKTGSLFRVDIFSQNEVECTADRPQSQLALIDSFEAERIAEIESRLMRVRADLATNAGQIVPLVAKIAALGEQLSTLPEIEQRLQKYSTVGGQDGQVINESHRLKSLRDRERRTVHSGKQILQDFAQAAHHLHGRVLKQAKSLVDEEVSQGPNGSLVADVLREIDTCGAAVDHLLRDINNRIAASLTRIAATSKKLTSTQQEQELQFRTLIEQHQQAQGQAAERAEWDRRRNELLAKKRLREQLSEEQRSLQATRAELMQTLTDLQKERFGIREAVALRITASLEPTVRVHVEQSGDPTQYRRLVERGLKSSPVKYVSVAHKLTNAFWPHELVCAVRQGQAAKLVEQAGLNPDQADKVIAGLSDPAFLFELEAVELADRPRIELRDGDVYKDSSSLSTGQKCTTVLPILLLDGDRPLLVDQPEDNLDNRYVFETIVESLLKTKFNRQMLFLTHNPNIPVLGDAERVIVLDSNGVTARKANEGTVDECRIEIVTLLEGGARAFNARKRRYACE